MMSAHEVLTAAAHGDLRVRSDVGAALGDDVMACFTVPEEFRRIQLAFPILFRIDPAKDRFHAVALMGMEEGENLFLDGERWDAPYRPLSLAIQPFLVGAPPPGGEGAAQVHVDMANPRIAKAGEEGVRIFEDGGGPSPYLERVIEQLGTLDIGHRAATDYFDALRRHELLQPIAIDVPLPDGGSNRLVGFHGIDEERLAALDASALADLHQAGHLMPTFMAVASLGHLSTLIARKLARMQHG